MKLFGVTFPKGKVPRWRVGVTVYGEVHAATRDEYVAAKEELRQLAQTVLDRTLHRIKAEAHRETVTRRRQAMKIVAGTDLPRKSGRRTRKGPDARTPGPRAG